VHNELAVDMIKHFAIRAGFPWGYGIGIGGGGMISSMGEHWQSGPVGSIYNALSDLVQNIQNGENNLAYNLTRLRKQKRLDLGAGHSCIVGMCRSRIRGIGFLGKNAEKHSH
jgi:hypothetical protein